MREVAREAGSLLFLTGDAVRDLTSGHAVRDIEVAIQGICQLKKAIEKPEPKPGAKMWRLPASPVFRARFESTLSAPIAASIPSRGSQPSTSSIQDDLRRRDFTVNAMAISLNEGYHLSPDGSAERCGGWSRSDPASCFKLWIPRRTDISDSGRRGYIARLGWDLDPRTQTRYENAKAGNVIESLSPHDHSQELEQIGHEDDGHTVLRALEAEGWMKELFTAWTATKADEGADGTARSASPIADAGCASRHVGGADAVADREDGAKRFVGSGRSKMLRPGFVSEWNSLDSLAIGFAKVLLNKHATPSASCRSLPTTLRQCSGWDSQAKKAR